MALAAPGCPVWTRDVDVSAGHRLLAHVSTASGNSVERLSEMTLSQWASCTARDGHLQGINHWINSIGVYHRRRRRHGLGYCPMCLSDNGCFLRRWRLSFWTVCPLHNVQLLDCCPHCSEPVHAHRQVFDVACCWKCSSSLAKVNASPAAPTAAQALLTSALLGSRQCFEVYGFNCSGRDLLWGADGLLAAFGSSRQSETTGESQRRARLELRRSSLRHADMELLSQLLQADVEEVRCRAVATGVTQKCFRQTVPPWLASVISALPYGRSGQIAMKGAVVRRAASARNGRLDGWRSRRAALMLTLIGQRDEY